jgi:hypothetical protein
MHEADAGSRYSGYDKTVIELDAILAFGPAAAVAAGTGKSLLSGIGSKILGSAGSLLGGLFSSKSADKSWQRQLKLLEKQQSFTERMSNTSWQRGVADMKKAGINPLLAVSKGGASTPAAGGGTAPKADSLSPMDFLGMKAMEAQIGLTNAQELTEKERKDLVKNQRRSLEATAAFGDVIQELHQLLRDFRNTPTGQRVRDEIAELGNNNISSAEGTHRNNRDGELIAPEFEAKPKKKDNVPPVVDDFLNSLDLQGSRDEKMRQYMAWPKERRFNAVRRYEQRTGKRVHKELNQ